MQRLSYVESIQHIQKMLSCLANYIGISNSQGTTDINVACENLVILMMNSVYGYKLENYNGKRHLSNAAGIDLIDTSDNRICVQVTSNKTKKKIADTIKSCKENLKLKNYKLKFFIISKNASKVMRSYKDADLGFDGANDVIDFQSFCDYLKSVKHELVIELDRRIRSWLGENYYDTDEFSIAIDKQVSTNDIKWDGVYYPRKVSAYSNEDNTLFVKRLLNPDKYKDYSLAEFVTGKADGFYNKYWILIAAGQAGKSYEVKKLYSLLKEKDSDVFPVLFEAKKFVYRPELIIPYYWQSNHIVFIIDGYDEIPGDNERSRFLNELEKVQLKYPDLRIVLTCRRNFIKDEKFLQSFQRLFLEDLSFEDVRKIINQSEIENPDKFLQQIEDNNLYSLAYVPFYLNGLLDYYRENGTIPRNRLQIYRFLIDKSFQADNDRILGSIVDIRLKGLALLKHIALVMQFTEKKDLSIDDITEMGFRDNELKSCLSYTLFHKDDKEYYRFEKNAFQLYFVADYLSKLNAEDVLNLISLRKDGINRIKPEWLDAVELLLSVMPDGKEKNYILNWIFENNTEALLNIDPTCIDTSLCYEVFKKILLKYKKMNISSSPEFGLSFDRKLAALCLNQDSLNFFLNEYANETDLGAYLYLLSYIYSYINPNVITKYGLQKCYREVAYARLKKFGDNDSVWYSAPYIQFGNELFANAEDIRTLIEYAKTVSHVLLKKSIYKLIVTAKLNDEFVDYTTINEKYIHDYYSKRDHSIVSVSRECVIDALSNVSRYKSVKKVWQYIPTIVENQYGYHEKDTIKILPQLFKSTENIIDANPDLKIYIDNAWTIIYENLHLLKNDVEKNNVFELFNSFMTAHSHIDEAKDIIEQLRMIFKTKGSFDGILSLQAKLLIRLRPGDITTLSATWGDDEYYRTILLRLKNVPSKKIEEEFEALANAIYSEYLKSLPNVHFYENKRTHDKDIAFNRKLFRQYITSVLNKYSITTKKELRFQQKEDDEFQLNEYLWQYLYHYRINDSEVYDIDAVRNSLKSKFHYALFIVNTFHNDDNITNKQILVLKDSVDTLLSSKCFKLNYNGYRICTNILVKFGFDISEEIILRLIRYAGSSTTSSGYAYSDYIEYAYNKCNKTLVKAEIIKLLKLETKELVTSTLDLLVLYAAKYSIIESYSDVVRHIKTLEHPVNLADYFYRNNENEGRLVLISNFDCLPADVQLYLVSKIIKDNRDKDWIVYALRRNKHLYNEEQNTEAIRYLVILGEELALQECLSAIRVNKDSLWSSHYVPTFGYKDTKYLPQIMELLLLTWDSDNSYDFWHTRLQDTMLKMACQSIDQFTEVVSELEKLIESDKKYSRLNYFIGELRYIHEPKVIGVKPLSVKEAMHYIDGNSF